jgi:hypothetical protein
MSARVVYKSQEVECLFREGSSDYLLVTFNEMDMSANGENYWAEEVCNNLDMTTIGIVSATPNWFPTSALRPAIDVLRSDILSNYQEIVGYGFSQGAYGAIKYSKELGSSTTMAFCPQWSIAVPDVGFGPYKNFYDEELHKDMSIKPDDVHGNIFLFGDSWDVHDKVHLSEISRLPGVKFINLFNTAHTSVRGVNSSALFSDLLRVCRGDFDARALDTISNKIKKNNPLRGGIILDRIALRHPSICHKIFSANYADVPVAIWPRISLKLFQRGYRSFSVMLMEKIVFGEERDVDSLGVYSIMLRDLKRYEEAFEFVEQGLCLSPSNERLLAIRDSIKKFSSSAKS